MNLSLSEASEAFGLAWGLEPDPIVAARRQTDKTGDPRICASIRVAGSWNGLILMDCPMQLARSIASDMFGMRPDQVHDRDVRCALSSMARSMFDSLRGVLPNDCCASVPVIHDQDNAWNVLSGAWPLGELRFCGDGRTVSVAIAEVIEPLAMAA